MEEFVASELGKEAAAAKRRRKLGEEEAAKPDGKGDGHGSLKNT